MKHSNSMSETKSFRASLSVRMPCDYSQWETATQPRQDDKTPGPSGVKVWVITSNKKSQIYWGVLRWRKCRISSTLSVIRFSHRTDTSDKSLDFQTQIIFASSICSSIFNDLPWCLFHLSNDILHAWNGLFLEINTNIKLNLFKNHFYQSWINKKKLSPPWFSFGIKNLCHIFIYTLKPIISVYICAG